MYKIVVFGSGVLCFLSNEKCFGKNEYFNEQSAHKAAKKELKPGTKYMVLPVHTV